MKRKFLLLASLFFLYGVLTAQTDYTTHYPSYTMGTYADFTPIIGVVVVDGDTLKSEAVEVVAFCGEEARSTDDSRFLMYYPLGGKYLALMSVYGESGEEVTFKMYDHETGMGEDYTCSTTCTLTPPDAIGSNDNPIVIEFTSNEEEEEDEIAYPWTITQGDGGNAIGYFWVQINGQDLPAEDYARYTLGVFHDTICRGFLTEPYEIPFEPYAYWDLVVYGVSGEEDYFLLYDTEKERYVGTCDATITYSADAVYGSPQNLFILNFIVPYIFDGSDSDHNWSTESNWRYEMLPGDTDEATINAYCELDQNDTVNNIIVNEGMSLKVMPGMSLTLNEGITTTDASQFILTDDAQLFDANQTAAKASYMLTVTSYETDENNWYLFGSPMSTNVSIASSTFPTTESDYDLYWYNESNLSHEEWRNYKAVGDTTFIPGVGYLYANAADCTPSLAGTLNYGNVSIDMTYTDRSFDDLDGLNLLANPYPFAITMDNFSNTSLSDGFYVLEGGAWSSQASTTTIKTGQAFLIGCTGATTVNFQSTPANKRGNTDNTSIKVNISNGEKADHAYLILNEGNDLVKVGHRSQDIPEVYIPMNNKAYAIAHFAKETESATVAYIPTREGQQTLSVELEGSYAFLTLTDNVTGTVVDLLSTPSYTFNANENDMLNRFTLSFKANTNVEENEILNPITYRHDGLLSISGIEGESQLQVIDMMGRIISSTTINGNYSQMINNTPGVYVIRVVSENNSYTQKIVVE